MTRASFTPPPTPHVLHWFRRSLRLHDNPSLAAAAAHARAHSLPLVHVYLHAPHANPHRGAFLRASLRALDGALRARGSRLHVLRGDLPLAAAAALFFEAETAAAARTRDARVMEEAHRLGVMVEVGRGHMLWSVEEVVRAGGGAAPRKMAGMREVLNVLGEPGGEAEVGEMMAVPEGWEEVAGVGDEGWGGGGEGRWVGGEEEGLRRLEEFVGKDGGRAAAYFEKPNTSPAEFEDARLETSVLSPHLALGTVSARRVWHAARGAQECCGGGSVPPESVIGQLLFREMFHALCGSVHGFERMGSDVCRHVDWGGDGEEERLRLFEAAQTGYPWIDALVVQLKNEGWVHHLGRHSLACFLTRGDLWVGWEKGADFFERWLVDWDEALNAGNWMWLSCSAFFSMYFRVYSPVAFPKRWSAAPAFVRHYLPVLRDVPDKYIFEPWKMPPGVAKKAGVVVGRDYPLRMVDHAVVRQENIDKMAVAYGKAKTAKKAKEVGKAEAKPKPVRGKGKRPAHGSSSGMKRYRMSK